MTSSLKRNLKSGSSVVVRAVGAFVLPASKNVGQNTRPDMKARNNFIARLSMTKWIHTEQHMIKW